ncbi:MAG: hypothetical protein WAK19_16895 [Candidatus Cybelea sp.]
MKKSLTACALIAILTGCGGESAPLSSTPAAPRSNAPASPQGENLLYVIVAGFSEVTFYTYLPAKLKLAGKLTGLSKPNGLCVDKTGDVYVTEDGLIEKYAHGGTKPIATLKISGESAGNCAVDPATGDLAAVAYDKSDTGSILIFANGQGTPAQYIDPRLQYPDALGYDNASNLYVDGVFYRYRSSSCCFYPNYRYLPAKRHTFKTLNLNVGIDSPSSVQWDGKDLAIEDAYSGEIHEYSINASVATEVGHTKLRGIPPSLYQVGSVWIAGDDVVGTAPSYAEVGIWRYPKGGKPLHRITGLYNPVAVAVSAKS